MQYGRNSTNLHSIFSSKMPFVGLSLVFALTVAIQPASAQTYNVIYNFTGGNDGSFPVNGVTFDRVGNLYGTTWQGGTNEAGTVFQLIRRRSGWSFNSLHRFAGGNLDGSTPYSKLIFGPDGALYGTTIGGGGGPCIMVYVGCGIVFSLTPPPTPSTSISMGWNETVLHRFTAGADSFHPQGDLAFDQADNLYGATWGQPPEDKSRPQGGDAGSIYMLSRSGSGWNLTPLYDFAGAPDGATPRGVTFDTAGDLVGTTLQGGSSNFGTVFQLTHHGANWTESILHSFNGADGSLVTAGLVADASGNLYGIAADGIGGKGIAFQLTPSNGTWTFSIIFAMNGIGSLYTLAIDSAGNLYGSTENGGARGCGDIYKLTQSNGVWSYTDLYDFTCGSDGNGPSGSLTLDAAGNIYGTTINGGQYSCGGLGCGVVFKITP